MGVDEIFDKRNKHLCNSIAVTLTNFSLDISLWSQIENTGPFWLVVSFLLCRFFAFERWSWEVFLTEILEYHSVLEESTGRWTLGRKRRIDSQFYSDGTLIQYNFWGMPGEAQLFSLRLVAIDIIVSITENKREGAQRQNGERKPVRRRPK